jgi:hypothetical protein
MKRRGSMARRKSLRSQLYRAAPDMGNIDAAAKGPSSYGRRVVRRKVDAQTNGALGKLLRVFPRG